MKAVFDVGPLVSATINRQGHPGQLFTARRAGKFDLVTSVPPRQFLEILAAQKSQTE